MAMTNKIKIYRAMKNMTQEDLAEKVGVTRQTIIAIEKGNYSPSLELTFKIAKVFNKQIESIFKYE
ncbi:helix-turn-helix transcriptional regulator [Patescibacteria group bacterium]